MDPDMGPSQNTIKCSLAECCLKIKSQAKLWRQVKREEQGWQSERDQTRGLYGDELGNPEGAPIQHLPGRD